MRQLRWLEVLGDLNDKMSCHATEATITANALCMKFRAGKIDSKCIWIVSASYPPQVDG
jgi:hypothetical protein